MADSTIRRLLNLFTIGTKQPSGMVSDTPISQQPAGTFRNAWGVNKGTSNETGQGVFSEEGMELCASLPDGYIERGRHYIEEGKRWVMFSFNPKINKSEIGVIHKDKCTYVKVLNDNDIKGCDLDFGMNEWIKIVDKPIRDGTCYDTYIYWSNGLTYKRLNIDNPCLPMDCEEILLLKCHAMKTAEPHVSESGGRDLESGIYQYVTQYEDDDGNTTNWFQVGPVVSIGSEKNKPGEPSRESIHLKLDDLSKYYTKLNIAVVKTIGGNTSAYMLDKQYYTTDGIEFIHRSVSQEKYRIDIQEILARKQGYFRGSDLFQDDGTLYPYNIIDEANEQMQELVDQIEVGYRIVGVPLEQAHLYSGLRADEVYGLGISANYCDGTRSRYFHVKGRKAKASDRTLVSPGDDNCLDCEKERWEVENTAERTETICNLPVEVDIRGSTRYKADPFVFEENPVPDSDDLTVDEAGLPDESDLTNMQSDYLRQMECSCQNLAAVHAMFILYIRTGLFGIRNFNPVFSPSVVSTVLSDPVSVAHSYCLCQELKRKGKDKGPTTDKGGTVTTPGG